MEYLFVDTTFWVARFNRRDKHHREAAALFHELSEGKWGNFRLVTSDYVFDETVTAVLARTRNHAIAERVGRAVRDSEAVRLAYIGPAGFEAAWVLFTERADKEWSFTDCTSFVLMEREGLRKALSFDENFKQAGLATLP